MDNFGVSIVDMLILIFDFYVIIYWVLGIDLFMNFFDGDCLVLIIDGGELIECLFG